MKLRDLVEKIFEDVIIYNRGVDDYVDIHTGSVESIPCSVLDMDVVAIGVQYDNNILEIQVR